MTSKKLLVNKSLILSDLKRFKWGSIIYLIFLFLTTNLVFLTQMPFIEHTAVAEWLAIMSNFNTVFLIGVTVVVGILTLRRQSSKKQLFFERALPIKEHSALLSHIISGFILMIVPILINSIIMVLVMLLDSSGSIEFVMIIGFIAKALLSILVLFAFVCFSNVLTGNPFAGVVLNGIIQALPLMLVTTFESFASRFLHGFPSWDSTISDFIIDNIPISKLFTIINNTVYNSKFYVGVIYLVILSVILYTLSILLGTKRKAEDVETMICFKHLAPVLKYLLTVLMASLEMLILYDMGMGNVFSAVFIAISSAILFFGIEMLQQKSVHVFKTLPGFLITGILFCGAIAFMANTTFFGYETHIPQRDEIKSASIIGAYADRDITTDDDEYISFVLDKHSKYINTNRKMAENYTIKIHYLLKDGTNLIRNYTVSENEHEQIKAMCLNTKSYIEQYKKHAINDYQWYFAPPEVYEPEAVEDTQVTE